MYQPADGTVTTNSAPSFGRSVGIAVLSSTMERSGCNAPTTMSCTDVPFDAYVIEPAGLRAIAVDPVLVDDVVPEDVRRARIAAAMGAPRVMALPMIAPPFGRARRRRSCASKVWSAGSSAGRTD